MQTTTDEDLSASGHDNGHGSPLTEDDIATTAYYIYLRNGYEEGRELDHWLEAERLVNEGNHVAP